MFAIKERLYAHPVFRRLAYSISFYDMPLAPNFGHTGFHTILQKVLAVWKKSRSPESNNLQASQDISKYVALFRRTATKSSLHLTPKKRRNASRRVGKGQFSVGLHSRNSGSPFAADEWTPGMGNGLAFLHVDLKTVPRPF